MNAISQTLFDLVEATLKRYGIVVISVNNRGDALSCSIVATTANNAQYTEAYLYVGRSSATRYESAEPRMFSKDVQELVTRLKEETKDFRVAIFERALPSGRHSFTLEIVLGYLQDKMAALCFSLDHDDERNWDKQVVEMLLEESHK